VYQLQTITLRLEDLLTLEVLESQSHLEDQNFLGCLEILEILMNHLLHLKHQKLY
jgi:hypothetical protein